MFYPKELRHDELTVLKHYFPEFNGTGKYNSNLRYDDKNASMHIAYKRGKIIISDFGRTDTIGLNVVSYVRKLLNYPDTKEGYYSTLAKIEQDLLHNNRLPNLNYLRAKLIEKEPPVIRYRSRDYFSWKIDDIFWQPILKDVSKDKLIEVLKLFNVSFLEFYWINNLCIKVQQSNPTYCYTLGSRRKLYSPYALNYKWISNLNKDDILGLDCLPETGEILIIDKSHKDVICNYLCGYPSISVPSESSFIPVKLLEQLKLRFKKIYIHMDNDEAGRLATEKFSTEYGLPYYFTDDCKDNFEYITKYSLVDLTNILNKL